MCFERCNFIVSYKEPYCNKSAEKHSKGTYLINDHGDTAKTVSDNKGNRNLMLYYIVQSLKKVYHDIQHYKGRHAEQEYL